MATPSMTNASTTTLTSSPPDHGRSAFFYGTLMAPRIIHRVCYGSDVPMNSSNKFSTRPAILHDHIRKRVKYADYPGVIPTKGSTVRGTYVTGLTLRHIDHLDAFEGGEYTRQRVSVRLLKEGGVERSGEGSVESEEEFLCETYIYTHPPSCLEDREWDFAEFMCEKQHNWVGDAGETDYEDVAKHVAAGGHDGTGGRGANGGDITAALLVQQKKRHMN